MSGSLPHAVETGTAADGKTARPVSVCHVASGDLWAGAEVQLAALLRALSADPAISLRGILLNEGRLADEMRRLGVPLLVAPESQLNFFEIGRRATEWLAGSRVQLLHSHRYKENMLAALLARRCGIRYLVRTQHGLQEPVRGFRSARHRLIHGLDRLVGRFEADRVIAVSREMQTRLEGCFGASKVALIQNGLDVSQVKSAQTGAQAKQRLGLDPACAVVGTAGRLQPIKRFDLFLATAKKVLEARPETRFVVAGDGPQRTWLQDLAARLELGDRVLFVGHRDDVYDVLRSMDLFLITSDHEGLPMVLLEAMALSVPVVARRVGGLSEVLQEDAGKLVDSAAPEPLARACLELLADRAQRDALARAAFDRVSSQYSARQTAQRVAELYRSLVYSGEGQA